MKIHYANEAGKGLSVIVGDIGREALVVEGLAYRATEEELAAEIDAIRAEFGVVEAVRYDTGAEMVRIYDCPLDA